MPLLSIVVLVYNSEKYIKNCLDSIVNQDFNDYELIIVDDGSIDKSKEIIDSYKGSNVKIIHKTNEGIAHSRKCGIDNSNGKYIWIIDGDDAIDKDAFETINFLIKDDNVDILRFNYKIVDGDQVKGAYDIYQSGIYDNLNLIALRHHLIRNSYTKIFPHWIQIYKKDVIKDLPVISEKEVFGDDIVFNCLAYQKAKTVKIVSDALYLYYKRENSFSRSNKPILNGMINSYIFVKNEYLKLGLFEEFKDDLLYTFIDYSLLNDGRNGWGGIVEEYARYDDQSKQREMVKEVISSNKFQEIVKDNKGRNLSKELNDLYHILENKDEEALYHYLGRLATK